MTYRLQAATGGSGPPQRGFGAWIAGRARRLEYWAWMVPLVVLEILLSDFGMAAMLGLGIVRLLILIRRLHDLGWTGWLAPAFNFFTGMLGVALGAAIGLTNGQQIASVIVLVGIIALGCIPPEARDNEFGPGPTRKADLKETFS